MATLQQTFSSGSKFEEQLTQVILKYTRHIWRNIRVETLLTVNGTTEIDILFCYKNILFVVEAKNVASISGDYDSKNWDFIGSKSTHKDMKEYTSLNTVVQNNIHVRSLKDCFYAYFREWPVVIPLIVVPSTCMVSSDIADSIFTVSQLDGFLVEASDWQAESNLHRRIASILSENGKFIQRPDFVFDAIRGVRVKGDVNGSN